MKTLAKGKSSKAVLKLIRVLLNTSQDNYGDTDPSAIKEIADVIESKGAIRVAIKGTILMMDSEAQKRDDKYAHLGNDIGIANDVLFEDS